jgi:hypothetical protein
VPGISDWFFHEELKPKSDALLGAGIVCNTWLQQKYQLESGNGNYYDWQITGGTFDNMDEATTQVDLTWLGNNPNYQLSVTPYNELDAKGDKITMNITIQNNVTNTFLNQSSDWSDINNWNLQHVPLACEDVMINVTPDPTDIIISSPAEINSLHIDPNINLINNSTLTINQKNQTDPVFTLFNNGTINNSGNLYIYSHLMSQQTILSENSSINNSGEIRIEQKP